jgi:butyrate kinase
MPFLLVVNPGSTSTKVALYEDAGLVRANVFRYDPPALAQFGRVWDQFDFRPGPVRTWAGANHVPLSAVVAVGGKVPILIPSRADKSDAKLLSVALGIIMSEHLRTS